MKSILLQGASEIVADKVDRFYKALCFVMVSTCEDSYLFSMGITQCELETVFKCPAICVVLTWFEEQTLGSTQPCVSQRSVLYFPDGITNCIGSKWFTHFMGVSECSEPSTICEALPKMQTQSSLEASTHLHQMNAHCDNLQEWGLRG